MWPFLCRAAPYGCSHRGGGCRWWAGVDYEGSRSQSHCSANYSLREYANNVVWGIGDVCREFELPHPIIISESGRAITAHHAVLVSNVIGTERVESCELDAPDESAPLLLQNMWKSWLGVNEDDPGLLEIFHDSGLTWRMFTASTPWGC